MTKYIPTEEDQELTRVEHEVVPSTALSEKEGDDIVYSTEVNPIVLCSLCKTPGQEGTCYEDVEFIHCKNPISDLSKEIRGDIANIEQYSSYIYGGYGSHYDFQLIMLKPDQDAMIKDGLCNKCLTRALRKIGTIDTYVYGFGSKMTFHQMGV